MSFSAILATTLYFHCFTFDSYLKVKTSNSLKFIFYKTRFYCFMPLKVKFGLIRGLYSFQKLINIHYGYLVKKNKTISMLKQKYLMLYFANVAKLSNASFFNYHFFSIFVFKYLPLLRSKQNTITLQVNKKQPSIFSVKELNLLIGNKSHFDFFSWGLPFHFSFASNSNSYKVFLLFFNFCLN